MKILIVEDDELMQQTLKHVFSEHDCTVVNSFEDAEKALAENNFMAAFLDIQLKGPAEKDGRLLLRKIQEQDQFLPCVMISGLSDAKIISDCMEWGAVDYVAKGTVNAQAYKIALLKALNWKKLISESRAGKKYFPLEQDGDDLGIKGISDAVKVLREQIKTVWGMPGPFLILGETGSGKELVARALWSGLKKSHRPFIAVNSASLPENLVESELFGYEKGAFTGALNSKNGLFEAANGGDIFLDEIGELNLDLQSKLLRVLQEKKVRRLGSDKERPVDFRVIAATNVNLAEAVSKKEFREDMFYRLNVYTIKVPPLRERKEDILELLKFFLNEMNMTGFKITPEASDKLKNYSWPGNVRQLRTFALWALPQMVSQKNITENMVQTWIGTQAIGATKNSGAPDVSQQIKDALNSQKPLDVVGLIEGLQRSYVEAALKETKNNRSAAAKILGVSRQRLSNWLAEWGIY